VDRDEFSYFPYLIAGGRGELAATWSSGKDDTLQAHVAKIDVRGSKALPQVIEAKPFQIDVWSRVLEEHPTPVHRTTGGEYIPVVFLRSGSLGVVTTIANRPEKRLGIYMVEVRDPLKS
jgi:hypothetical protein